MAREYYWKEFSEKALYGDDFFEEDLGEENLEALWAEVHEKAWYKELLAAQGDSFITEFSDEFDEDEEDFAAYGYAFRDDLAFGDFDYPVVED